MSEHRSVLVLGTTAFSAEIADVCTAAGFDVAGFVEDLTRERTSESHAGLPVHWIDDTAGLAESHLALCGLETARRSVFVERVQALGFRFATVVHPAAYVPPTTTLGEGSILSAGVAVAAHTTIGRHVLVDRGSLLGHHTTIGDFTSIRPGANVAGSCRVGDHVDVGTGAVVIDHLSIGAGAVVVKDVPAGVRVVGVPARIVEDSGEGW